MSSSSISVSMLIIMENNLAAAVDFYKKLGLELTFYVPSKWAEFEINGVKLGLASTFDELPERRTGIVLGVADVRATYEKLSKEGVTFLGEPQEALHGIVVSLKDPGNNILEMYQQTPEKVREFAKKMANEDACCRPQDQADPEDSCCKKSCSE